MNPELSRNPARLARNSIKARLKSQATVIGTFLQINSPAIVEILGLAGFDFVVVDCEHGAIGLGDTESLIRAGCSTEISVLVRVANSEANGISRPLDMGAAGVHVPQVDTAEAARAVVAASKYHPLGTRGLQAYVRSASYRAYSTADYLQAANTDTLIVVHVEGQKGIANLESILQVEDLDVVFIGPYDLSQSLGIPGQVNDTRVRQAVVEARRLAQSRGKCVGTYCDDIATALAYRDLGVSYLTVSIDSHILLSSCRCMVQQLTSKG